MGGGLYEAAFAAVVRLYGTVSRGAITGITLFAGFASTVGWPLSSFMEAHYGWRSACLTWAVLHLGKVCTTQHSGRRHASDVRADVDDDV